MTDYCKSFIKFYRGCGMSDSEMIFEFLKNLPDNNCPSFSDEVRQYLLTLSRPDPIMELNGGEVK